MSSQGKKTVHFIIIILLKYMIEEIKAFLFVNIKLIKQEETSCSEKLNWY